MSYELVAPETGSLGQFASNRGYADLIAAARGYDALERLFEAGEARGEDAIGDCVEELHELAASAGGTVPGVAETAKELARLMDGQEQVLITDGTAEEDGDLEKQHTDAMIAYILPPGQQKALAVEGGEDAAELHLTLLYLGKELTEEQITTVQHVVREVAAGLAPLQGTVGGKGRFPAAAGTEDRDVIVRMVDVPRLEALREALISALRIAGVEPVLNHGYTPHITLAYVDPDHEGVCAHPEPLELNIDVLTVAAGGRHFRFALAGEEVVKATPRHGAQEDVPAQIAIAAYKKDYEVQHDDAPKEDAYEVIALSNAVYRVTDGWGEVYVGVKDGKGHVLARKYADVAAFWAAPPLDKVLTKEKVREIGWGDKAWDRLITEELGKRQQDALHYRESAGTASCRSCVHGGDGYCDLYKFPVRRMMTCDSHEPMEKGYEKYTPPQPVQANARKAKEQYRASEDRVTDEQVLLLMEALSNGRPLSVEEIRFMRDYLTEHYQVEDPESWAGHGAEWQAWNALGGRAGLSWARRVLRREQEFAAGKRLMEDWFGKSNSCHDAKGRFCETGGGQVTAGSSTYSGDAKIVEDAIGGLPAKFRVASPEIVVTDMSSSTLLKQKLIGIHGATDIDAGKIEIYQSKPGGFVPPMSAGRLGAVAVHEYGHAVDGHLGRTGGGRFASSDPAFVVALAKDYSKLPRSRAKKLYGYLGGDAKEVFAEAFSIHSTGSSFLLQFSAQNNFASDFSNVMSHVGGLF